MGQFIVDPKKAVVILDSDRLKMYPARIPTAVVARTSASPTNIPAASPPAACDTLQCANIDPLYFVTTQMDLMLGGLLGPSSTSNSLRGQVVGPPEAFFPFTSIDHEGNVVEDESDWYDYDEEDDEDMMDIHDLIDFGEAGDSRMEEEDQINGGEAGPLESPATATEAESSGATASESHRRPERRSEILSHLNGDVVAAFRSHQDRYRLISREPHHPALRTSIHNALQSGRAAAAENPISPMRKRKLSAAFPGPISPPAKKAKDEQARRAVNALSF